MNGSCPVQRQKSAFFTARNKNKNGQSKKRKSGLSVKASVGFDSLQNN